jgi:hypothetical protein
MAQRKGTEALPQKRKAEAMRRKDGTFGPGNAGNPGGVPQWRRAFVEAFGERCAPLAEHILYSAMSGKHPDTGKPDKKVTLNHRMEAAAEVLKYVLPKPKQQVEVSGDGTSPFSSLTPEQLVAIATGRVQEGT